VRLTYLERGAYATAIAIALFSVFVDIPINMLIVSVIPLDPDHRSMIHLIARIGAAYSLVWVLGDRWLVRGGGHVLTSTEHDLQVGARTSGTIPLASIASCESVNEKRAEWCKRFRRQADALPDGAKGSVLRVPVCRSPRAARRMSRRLAAL
jgi:hypothetical protein